jgi:hypothetical protein
VNGAPDNLKVRKPQGEKTSRSTKPQGQQNLKVRKADPIPAEFSKHKIARYRSAC